MGLLVYVGLAAHHDMTCPTDLGFWTIYKTAVPIWPMTLLSAVITLQSQTPVELPAQQGRALHAWFLAQVQAHDPAMAERLHAPNVLRPFTVSNLRPDFERPLRSAILRVDGSAYVRITSYERSLSALLQEVILPNLPETIRLGGTNLRIAHATLDPREHPWARVQTYSELLSGLMEESPARITLRFVSPTVFKSQGLYMPLPLPRLVFESLIKRWNAYAPVAAPPETAEFAESYVALSNYHLRTAHVRMNERGEGPSLPGFWGRCRFAILRRDRYWAQLLHLLADFAFYAGVGKETARGLGQCQKI